MIKKEEKLDAETEFFSGLLELSYGQEVEEKLRELSFRVPWARGWPEDKQAFWNAEAFMWWHKIGPEKRKLIEKELTFLKGRNNLDLGCGSYCYLPSVGFDFSEKMLQFNDHCLKKVKGDLEKPLPFKNKEFDSVTAVFVSNYVKNYNLLLDEVKRVLEEKGVFVLVLSTGGLSFWPQQKEVNHFSVKEWCSILKKAGFKVKFYEKEKIGFFRCRNQKSLLK